MTLDTTQLGILIAVIALLLAAVMLLRRNKAAPRVERRDSEPYVASTERPYVKNPVADGGEGNAVTDSAAAATADVAGAVLDVDAHRELPGATGAPDDLGKLKGVGPKLIARLHELGVNRFDQIAGMNEAELAHLDERLGPFKGRLARDRVSEQAGYLSRGDIDGFEEKFGKLG